jgi:hypothetical protein
VWGDIADCGLRISDSRFGDFRFKIFLIGVKVLNPQYKMDL